MFGRSTSMLATIVRIVNNNIRASATSIDAAKKNLFFFRHDVASPTVLKEMEDLTKAELCVLHHLVARRMTHSDYHNRVYERYLTYHW